MQPGSISHVFHDKAILSSIHLERDVIVDFFLPKNAPDSSNNNLLLINDGQDMKELGLEFILENLYSQNRMQPLWCAAIHAGSDRRREYGVAATADYLGRGDRAMAYTSFIRRELIPYIKSSFAIPHFREMGFAGFSLGGLSAMDIIWSHPSEFSKVGIFSGSFWWRTVDQTDPSYEEDRHRIMHQAVRNGKYHAGLKFFFQCGNMDETVDRNNNGIIDSIDDTLDLIKELVSKGYDRRQDIHYLELPDGRHDLATWARAMPIFLQWGWGNQP